MRAPGRLSLLALFAGLSLLALVVSGLLDWITSTLFLALEFLAELLRHLFSRRVPSRDHGHARIRKLPSTTIHNRPLSRRIVRRKGRSRSHHLLAATTEPLANAARKCRILVPLSADEPELIAFALDECRARDAELLLLFLRPLAMTPMGPNPLPGLDEDGAARAMFDRIGREAEGAGVPLRTIYERTFDRMATILDVTRRHEADVLLVGTSRRSWFRKALAGDMALSILAHLPERASVMVHAV